MPADPRPRRNRTWTLAWSLTWLLVLLVSAAAFVAVGLGTTTGAGARLDEGARDVVLNALPEPVSRGLGELARTTAIVVLVPATALLVLLGLVRRAWLRAAAALVVAAVPGGLSLGLTLTDPLRASRDGFPSDHASLALGLLVAVVVLWPRPVGRRGLVLALLAAVAIGVGNVSSHAHLPGDVVGSALLVGCAGATAFALLGPRSTNVHLSARD